MSEQKIKYGASVQFTNLTLASLASDTNLLAGAESDVVDNSSNLYIDELVGGKVTTGTTPTVDKEIQIWVYAAVNDTPLYPDVFDGTGSAETVTSANVKNGALRLLASIRIDNTSDRTYWLAPTSVAALFGGVMPQRWGLFIVHNTGANLNATGSNHAFYHTPVTYTVT